MAEAVQIQMEKMIPELEDLEEKGIFSKNEIKMIVKKRRDFEYSLRRRATEKENFLKYIEFEMNLESLRKTRKKRLAIRKKNSISDFSIPQRIHFIYRRALQKYRGDVRLWMQYIEYCKSKSSYKTLAKIFAEALQFHPQNSTLWISAAKFEFEMNSNISAARIIFQRAIRMNEDSTKLWCEYFRLELLFLEKILLRRRVLGLEKDEA
eukprot:Sdes_comp19124_c0_seq1m9837